MVGTERSKLINARSDVDKNPTEKQKEAGNYKKGHVNIHGFNITIENPKGSYRKGKDKDGKEWKTLMHNDYGYFTRTLGKDGDAIDVFIGPNLESTKIFPVDQYVDGEFDETKIMLGFDSKEQAKAAYLSNYEKDWKGFKYISEIGIDEFKKWLYDGMRQRKAFALYKSLNENREMLNEKFSSKKLAQLAKEHGGIGVSRNGGIRDFVKAWQYGHGIDVSTVTDDMLVGEPFEYDYRTITPSQHNNAILFNDGYAIEIDKNAETKKPISGERKIARFGSGVGDTGDHNKSRGGFVGKGKDVVSAPYNGFAFSDRAGEAQGKREALGYNKEVGDKKTEREVRKRSRDLINRDKSLAGKKQITLNEEQLRKIISECITEYLQK